MPPRRRSSLLVKLLAVSAVVTLLSIAATAWLAVRTTTKAFHQEQGQALTDDAKIYDALLGYAATHPDWSGVGPLVDSLSRSTGHRIALTDHARIPIADSAPGALPDLPSATVDPLGVDENLVPAASDDRIDPRAVGPFKLPAAERNNLHAIATRVAECLRGPAQQEAITGVELQEPRTGQAGIGDPEILDEQSGRPRVVMRGAGVASTDLCASPRAELATPTATERRALSQLGKLVNACLARRRVASVEVGLNQSWTWAAAASAPAARRDDDVVVDCLATSRRDQLTAYVAPAALLYVTAPGAAAPSSGFDLSGPNRTWIIAVTGLIMLVAIGATALVGLRLVRPLRALTAAAGRMRDGDGDARVTIAGRDEIASLGTAFNDMAERRREVEGLRRAMVGDIAHEMRSPVTNIRGWLEAAEDGVVPLDRALMTSMLEEAMLLQHVIDDLQDLSAADAGELRLHRQPVDLADLLPAVVDAFAAAADQAGVGLALRAPHAIIDADPVRLRQAIGNLVSNAIRHTPAGGRITVTSRTVGNAQVIDVADTGPGLSAAEQAMVFERFWRAEKSRSRQTGGSGLGLSIVRKLIEAHGGAVSVLSEPGAGATFTLRLPRG